MQTHFSSFTPEWARAFGQELRAFVVNLGQQEAQRRKDAETEAGGRRLYVSELRSGVHPLLDRFRLDHREMANELHATLEAFRSRPRPEAGFSFRRSAGTATPAFSASGEQGSHADLDGQERAKRSGKSHKRHD